MSVNNIWEYMRFINATNNKQLVKNLRAISLMDELKFHRILAFDRFGCITKKTLHLFPIRILLRSLSHNLKGKLMTLTKENR